LDAAFAGAKQDLPEYEIDQKCRRGAIVSDQVGKQDIQHIFVNGDMVHQTIVPESIAGLQCSRLSGNNAWRRKQP
jgi:hypothetical protein